jgi:integrase
MTTDKPDKKKSRRIGQREQLAPGKPLIRVFLGRDNATKKRHYHSEIFLGGAKQAEERIRELIRRHKAGEQLKVSADTFDAFLDEWIEAKRLSVEETSMRTYTLFIDLYIRPSLGGQLGAKITADEIQKLYGKLLKDGLQAGTVRYIHNLLAMVFKLALERKKLTASPMAGVKTPKDLRQNLAVSKPKARAMTADQVALFMAAAEGTRSGALFKLAFHIGCRPGELMGLKWTDIDTQARTLRVNQSIAWRKAGDWFLKTPKTALSRRTLPLTENLLELMATHRMKQLEARIKVGKLWTDHGFVFANEVGEPYPHWILRYDFEQILKAACLPENFSPYSARHTMATLLIANGTNPKAVSERLGHSKVAITLQAYTHVSPGMQAEVSQEIERLLGGQK